MALSCPPLRGLRVLVVDADEDNRELPAFVLHETGATVLSANDVGTALRAYDPLQPDLVVTELGVAPEPRYAILDAIRARANIQGNSVRVVAYTSFAAERERQRCVEHGSDAHFAEPMALDVLLEQLASIVGVSPSEPARRDSHRRAKLVIP